MKQKTKTNGPEDYADVFGVTYFPDRSGTYKIEINDVIYKAGQFSDAIFALENAKEEDAVEIYLQSPGGSIDAGDALIHAMRGCKAHIHIKATGNCSSMASAILLEAHSFELSEGFNSLLHCGSVGYGGTYHEFDQASKFYQKSMPAFIKRTYTGFLTEDEIEQLIGGKDFWIDAEEWVARHEARNDFQKSLMEAHLKKLEKAARKPRVKKSVKTVVDNSNKPVVE